jgi:cyanophycinase-like exopeptidase
MGRLVVFMSHILQDGWAASVRAIAVEENAAVLLEPNGTANVVGNGPAYFMELKQSPEVCRYQAPLRASGIMVHKTPAGSSFNVRSWKGDGGDDYQLAAADGKLAANGSSHGTY